MKLEVFFNKKAVSQDNARKILISAYDGMQGAMGDIDVETLDAEWYCQRIVRDDFAVKRFADAIRQAVSSDSITVTDPYQNGSRVAIDVGPAAPAPSA